MSTNQAGTVMEDTLVYPWGQTWKYTGNEWPGIFAGLDSFLCQLQPCPDQSQTRDYFPTPGRWLTPDPHNVGARPADPQTWNMYAYVGNNPTSLTDLSGLDFYLTCTPNKDNAQTCKQVRNGKGKAWVQGATINGSFDPTVISNDENGNLVDQNGNQFAGSFDQSGVQFTSESGIGGSGQFVEGSSRTDMFGCGVYLGIEGQFIDACGGSCKARGSIIDLMQGSGRLSRGGLSKPAQRLHHVF